MKTFVPEPDIQPLLKALRGHGLENEVFHPQSKRLQRKIKIAAPDDSARGTQGAQVLRGVQPRHAGKGDDRVGRCGLLHMFKELLLTGMALNLRKQPLRMAELGDLIHIGVSFLVPLGQYGDSVHSVPPLGSVLSACRD